MCARMHACMSVCIQRGVCARMHACMSVCIVRGVCAHARVHKVAEEGPGASQQRHKRHPPTGPAAAGVAPSFLPGPGVQAVEVTKDSSFLVLKSGAPGTTSPSPAAPRAADTHRSSRQQGLWPHPLGILRTSLGMHVRSSSSQGGEGVG